MYHHQKVSVVLPVYNEAEGIAAVIEDFFSCPEVDEVVAVDNNSTDASAAEIRKTRAKYVFEPVQGYGSALKRAMQEASGDIIITADSDSTYFASDIEKLLAYSNEIDFVFGSRMSRSLILPGAFMPLAVRLGNWAEAKVLSCLFDGPTLTEVGCTFKLIKRAAFEKIKDSLTVKGPHFSPELIIRAIQNGISFVEIPVFYRPRVGQSKGAGDIWSAIKVGVKMGWLIWGERFRSGKRVVEA